MLKFLSIFKTGSELGVEIISNKKYAMIFSVVLILFLVIGSVSALDLNNASEENAVFYEDLEVNDGSIPLSSSSEINDSNIKQSVLSANDVELYYKNGTSFKAVLSDDEGSLLANQKIIFTINDVNYTRTTNNDGVASIAINLNSGIYTISSFYAGNEMYSSSFTSNTVEVLSTIAGNDIVKYYKNDTQYYATFFDGYGNPLIGSQITFNINGVFYQRKTNENGVAKLNINLNPGEYILTATNSINGEMFANHIEVLPTITADELNMYYRDGHQFIANVVDGVGNPLAKSYVTFNINGLFYTRLTDNEGNAHLNINLNVGEYIITSTDYRGLSVANKIKIAKCNSIIKANDTHILPGNDKDYRVVLVGLNNQTIPFVPVYFKFNGVSTIVGTDENGVATLHISNPSKGKYSIEYEFKGDINYYPHKSSSTIIVADSTTVLTGNDLKMYYKDGSKFNVTLTDLNSVPMANETVTFNINGLSYNRTTNENGVAGLNINLWPGTYKISYSYSDVDAADYNEGLNTIVVSKIPAYISTNDLKFFYSDRKPFTATLTDAKKNPLEAIDVIFNINGVPYTRTTNASGVAKLNINLPVGYYGITTSINSIFYDVSAKSNHVLVNGTILEGNDLYLIQGFTRDYSIKVLNAYKNPIPNAVIEFTYEGISKRATTGSDGIATIDVGGLSKGDYPIVYKHVGENTVGQSYVHVSNSVLNSKNTISDLSPYLSSSNNCPVSNAEIVALANKLTGSFTKELDKAFAIFEYVRDTISYSYYYDTKYGAVGTLHAKAGNCVDQSHLLIALYRAAGFPARYVHGSCIFSDGDVSGHVWTQVLVDGTWIVGDAINVRNSLGNVVNWFNTYQHKGYYYSLPF